MDAWHYIGPYVFWIFLAVIIISGSFFSYLKARSRDSTIRDLAEKGLPVPSEMFRSAGPTNPSGLLIGGLVMLFIGIGLTVATWHMRGAEFGGAEHMPALVGAIPGGIGVALIISYIVLRKGGDKGGY